MYLLFPFLISSLPSAVLALELLRKRTCRLKSQSVIGSKDDEGDTAEPFDNIHNPLSTNDIGRRLHKRSSRAIVNSDDDGEDPRLLGKTPEPAGTGSDDLPAAAKSFEPVITHRNQSMDVDVTNSAGVEGRSEVIEEGNVDSEVVKGKAAPLIIEGEAVPLVVADEATSEAVS